MNLQKKIVLACTQKIVKRIKTHTRDHGGRFVSIPITGTVGKSSTTRLISELFLHNSYRVITGTSLVKNLNSLEGLGLSLLRYIVQLHTGDSIKDIENKLHLSVDGLSFWKRQMIKSKFVFWLIRYAYFDTKLSIDTLKDVAFIAEVGFDYQGEQAVFEGLFEGCDIAVVTNLTYEHAQNFNTIFDTKLYDSLKYYIDPHLQQSFASSQDGLLKNISLQQLCFLPFAQYSCYPALIGEISNQLITSTKGISKSNPKRSESYALGVGELFYHSRYILPDTMAKNIDIISFIAGIMNFDNQTIQKTISSEHIFPYSRFSKFVGVHNSTIIDSSYNADPASVNSFISTISDVIAFYEMNPVYDYKHTIVLGEMRELGDISQHEHMMILRELEVLQETYSKHIKEIILIGKEWLAVDQTGVLKQDGDVSYIQGTFKHYKVFQSAGDITRYLSHDTVNPEDWFWIKGSQNTIFLEIVVSHLLADKKDLTQVCRQGANWDKAREMYL